VITGGEPTLQQPALEAFLYVLTSHIGKLYIELETNGTILLRDRFLSFLSQVNCSPKLSNSSMPRERRYRLEVLRQFREIDPIGSCRAFLKFVITCPEDMAEVLQDFVEPLGWPSARVCLMPEGVTREDLAQKRIWLAEICKEYGFRYSDRLQVVIWDKVTGV
jgi:organic radical activating enzyme